MAILNFPEASIVKSDRFNHAVFVLSFSAKTSTSVSTPGKLAVALVTSEDDPSHYLFRVILNDSNSPTDTTTRYNIAGQHHINCVKSKDIDIMFDNLSDVRTEVEFRARWLLTETYGLTVRDSFTEDEWKQVAQMWENFIWVSAIDLLKS